MSKMGLYATGAAAWTGARTSARAWPETFGCDAFWCVNSTLGFAVLSTTET